MSDVTQDISLHQQLLPRIALAEFVANTAGSLMTDLFHKELKTNEKAPNDYVTELDKSIESMVLKNVLQSFPKDSFTGEENAGIVGNGQFSWIVDPIDGTNNFVRGLPLCGFQLAILFDEIPVYSIIIRPFTQETFVAQRGVGARYGNILTGEKAAVCVSDRTLEDALIIFDAQIGKSSNEATRLLSVLADKVATVRVLGVAVFDIPSVASGVAEILVTGIATRHDVAPGLLLLKEAGGEVYSVSGNEPGLDDELMIFSNKVVKPQVLDILKDFNNG